MKKMKKIIFKKINFYFFVISRFIPFFYFKKVIN